MQRFISAQNEHSLLARSPELDLCPAITHLGIGMLPYYLLASGLLAGRYRRDQTPAESSRVVAWGLGTLERPDVRHARTARHARSKTRPLALDFAIGGLTTRPTVASVIAAASSAEQLRANVQAATWTPDPQRK